MQPTFKMTDEEVVHIDFCLALRISWCLKGISNSKEYGREANEDNEVSLLTYCRYLGGD